MPNDEQPAASVGVPQRAIERVWNAAVRLHQTGLHPALALCIRCKGEVVLDRAIGRLRGSSRDGPPDATVPARPDTLFLLWSASKPVTAMVMHLLEERGHLRLDDPVARYVPEFARHGKERITLRHLMTHRAGIPNGVPLDPDTLADGRRMVAHVCDLRPRWPAGTRLAYHALTAGYLLAEIALRVTGRDLRGLLTSEILEPLGLRSLSYGVPAHRLADVAENVLTGLRMRPPISTVFERGMGTSLDRMVELCNQPQLLGAIVPSVNVIGTANDGSRFFELLLRGGTLDGKRIFRQDTVVRARIEQVRWEADALYGLPIRYATGFMLGRERLGPFGPGTPRAFGHVGFTSNLLFADPERDISVCLLTNGKPLLSPGQLRWLGLARLIAQAFPRRPL